MLRKWTCAEDARTSRARAVYWCPRRFTRHLFLPERETVRAASQRFRELASRGISALTWQKKPTAPPLSFTLRREQPRNGRFRPRRCPQRLPPRALGRASDSPRLWSQRTRRQGASHHPDAPIRLDNLTYLPDHPASSRSARCPRSPPPRPPPRRFLLSTQMVVVTPTSAFGSRRPSQRKATR